MATLRLEMTCGACPEQYDVYRGNVLVGYLRLRHGHFTADCPFDTIVYEADYSGGTQGDGRFDDDIRERYLRSACLAILKALGEDPSEPLFAIE